MAYLLPGDPLEGVYARRQRESLEQLHREAVSHMVDQSADREWEIYAIDGRSVSYRDPEDGCLIVLRAPYNARLPQDTGVLVTLDERDGTYQLGLYDAPAKPEYERDAVIFESDHRLCQACKDVFNYYCRYIAARQSVSMMNSTVARLIEQKVLHR
jgi:hypothetical protein